MSNQGSNQPPESSKPHHERTDTEPKAIREAEGAELTAAELGKLNKAAGALSFLDRVRKDLVENTNAAGTENAAKAYVSTLIDKNTMGGSLTVKTPLAIAETFGRFKIIETIGQGGFARVFLAHDPVLDREIALKIPRPQALGSDESRARFVREGKAVAMLSHPGIVAVFEAGAIGPIDYLACEYVAGENLANWFSRQQQTGVFEIVAVVKRIAEAVHHAHQRGVIHRDLKPSNILIEERDGELADRIRVADFGLAKDLSIDDDVTLTMEGAVVGTPAYMSPEQVRCDPDVGVGTDIYSMGVILYELLAGSPPHQKSGISATIHAVEFDPVPSLRKMRANVPVELDAICQKCLEKIPIARYSSAFELAADLDCFLNGLPVSAKPPGPLDRLNKWVKRNPIVASCLAVAFFALASGGMVSWLMYRQAETDRVAAIDANVQKTDALKLAETRLTEMHQQIDLMASVFDEIKSREHGGNSSELLVDSLHENLLLAAERVFESESDPGLRCNMAARIGISLGQIGFGKEASEVTRRALELDRKKTLSRPEILALELYAIIGLGKAGDMLAVIDEMPPIIDAIIECPAIKNRDKFAALGTLAHAYHNTNQPKQAARIFQRTVDFYDLLTSSETKNSAEHLLNTSEPTLRTGENFLDSRDARRRYATAIFQVAVNEYRQDKSKARLESLLKGRDRVEQELGGKDWGTIGVSYITADMLRQTGRVADAMTLAESALKNSIDSFGNDGFQTIMVINTLVITCASNMDEPICKSRLPGILASGRTACAQRLKKAGFHSDVFNTYRNVAKAYEMSGDLGNCLSVRRDLVTIARENQLDTKTIQEQVFELGMLLARNNENDEAAQNLNEFISVAKKLPATDAARVDAAKKMLESMDD